MTGRKLTERQCRFVAGIARGLTPTASARNAGYSPSFADREAARLVEKPQIRAALETLNRKLARSTIADASERQEFWSSVMRDAKVSWRHRLRASELLGRAGGDFIERRFEEHLQIDLTKMSGTDLERIQRGEHPVAVLAQSIRWGAKEVRF